jgi:hypothetical protein
VDFIETLLKKKIDADARSGPPIAADAAALPVAMGASELVDAHAPGVRTALQVVPGEIAWRLGPQQVVQRLGVVVAEDFERISETQCIEGRKDPSVVVALDGTQVNRRAGGD